MNDRMSLITRPGRLEPLRTQLRTELAGFAYTMAVDDGPLPDTVTVQLNFTGGSLAQELVVSVAGRHGAVIQYPRGAS